ncbi:MAG: glycosyltransferase involved in cell wall biosynthesis [Flavobacterium sp.]|jgi:glycosyltransferase involved in cell wall biosynthesis
MRNLGKQLSILQVCHDTKGPFINVCKQYVSAFDGNAVTTVFLKGCHDNDASNLVGGHRVIFLAEDAKQSKNLLSGLKLNTLVRMYHLLKESPYDIVITHRYKAMYIIGVLSFLFSIPKIISIAHEYNMFRRLSRRWFIHLLIGSRRSKFILAGVSTAVTQSMREQCPFLIKAAGLLTLYNTLDVDQAKSIMSKSDARRALNLPEDRPVIGCIGRLVKKKNHALLVQAFEKLDLEKAMLILIGGGPEEASLRDLVDQSKMTKSVLFVGSKNEAYRYVRAFDLFVLPSSKEEAFGIVLLESMMAKVPILSSNAPGPKEVLGEAGDYFDCGNMEDLCEKMNLVLSRPVENIQRRVETSHLRLISQFGFGEFRENLLKAAGLET